jgi:CRP-like cAMP-binding protein
MARENLVAIPTCADCKNRKESLLCRMKVNELEQISDAKSHKVFNKGDIIFREGAYPHGLFGIFKGKVKVYKIGEEGKEQIVRFANEGDLLGYHALLEGGKYAVNAKAMEETMLCHLPRDSFFLALKSNANVSFELMKELSMCLKQSERMLIDMMQKPVREKVAEALLILKESFGFEKDTNFLNVSLTRREIGDLASTTTESAIRVLSDFNKEGIIELSGKKIGFVDSKALVNLANLED